jgi:hypothetical protein
MVVPSVLVVAGLVCHIPLTKTAFLLAVGRSTARPGANFENFATRLF